jgi:hypothetical protein
MVPISLVNIFFYILKIKVIFIANEARTSSEQFSKNEISQISEPVQNIHERRKSIMEIGNADKMI